MEQLNKSILHLERMAKILAILAFLVSLYEIRWLLIVWVNSSDPDSLWGALQLNSRETFVFISSGVCLLLTYLGRLKKRIKILNLIWIFASLLIVCVFGYDIFGSYALSTISNSQVGHSTHLFLQNQLKYHWYLIVIIISFIGLLIVQSILVFKLEEVSVKNK